MKLRLALVSCLMFAAGCKTDAPQAAAGSAAAQASDSARAPRSGKIDLQRPKLRIDKEAPPPALDDAPRERRGRWGDPDATPEERQQRWEERRKQREANLDTNKDGTISPEEVTAAQLKRADDMRTRLDADGDGKLTVTELADSRLARRMDPAELDVDKNGEISADELKASMDRMRGGGRGGWGMRGRGRGVAGDGSGSATP